mgnify:CR=1 FL=1
MSRKTIGVCIIAKNEEAMIHRCLSSVAWADQHVVCDTGSVDRTVEIARQMGAEVYLDFVWCDAFDLAQNHAKSKMKTDVIISIDCDEVMLSSEAEVRESVEQMQDVLRVNMVAEGTMLNFGFGRIFRNTPDIFWCQSIHKHLNIPGEGEPIGNIRIMYGFSPAHLNDPDRSLRMLEHTVATEENPVRNLYYLGREYGYKKRWQDCIDTLLRYVAVSEWEAEKAEAYLEIGQAYTVLGKFQEAADSFLQAIKINTNFREVLLEMAKISSDDNAKQWRRMAKTASNVGVLWDRVPTEPNRNKIIISPHSDDAVLFCGFTMIRDRPQIIEVTDSFIQPERGEVGCDAETRRNESIAACAFLGCPVTFLGIRDTELTERALRERLKNIEAETIYIPAYHENGNSQHNLVNKVCLELFPIEKIEQYCSYSRTDLMVKGSYEVKPTEAEKALKNKAMNFYVSQINLNTMASHFEYIRNKSEWLL